VERREGTINVAMFVASFVTNQSLEIENVASFLRPQKANCTLNKISDWLK